MVALRCTCGTRSDLIVSSSLGLNGTNLSCSDLQLVCNHLGFGRLNLRANPDYWLASYPDFPIDPCPFIHSSIHGPKSCLHLPLFSQVRKIEGREDASSSVRTSHLCYNNRRLPQHQLPTQHQHQLPRHWHQPQPSSDRFLLRVFSSSVFESRKQMRQAYISRRHGVMGQFGSASPMLGSYSTL